MVKLLEVENDKYIVSDMDNTSDKLSLTELQLISIINYGVKVEGITLTKDNKILNAVPREVKEDKEEKDKVLKHLKKLGYVYDDNALLPDVIRGILDTLVAENELIE